MDVFILIQTFTGTKLGMLVVLVTVKLVKSFICNVKANMFKMNPCLDISQ